MKPEPLRILGVDTSLRSSGVAVVESRGNTLRAVEHGAVKTAPRRPVSECLGNLHKSIGEIVERARPQAAAIEGIFHCRNVKTAMTLGQARGVVIAVCALAGLPVYEYSPRRVKQALVGHGSADKKQVRKMVMSLLGMDEEPGEDAGDALAIAVCHLHNTTQHELLAPKAM